MAICRTCTILILVALAAGLAAAEDVGCPPRISTTQTLAQPAAGWVDKKNTSPNVLAGLTFFDGPPEEQASLAPDEYNPDCDTSTTSTVIPCAACDVAEYPWAMCLKSSFNTHPFSKTIAPSGMILLTLCILPLFSRCPSAVRPLPEMRMLSPSQISISSFS